MKNPQILGTNPAQLGSHQCFAFSVLLSMVVLICSCGTVSPMPTDEPIPVPAPRPLTEIELLQTLQPQHERLGVSTEDIDNAFLWCGLFQDAVRFDIRMRDQVVHLSSSSNWTTVYGEPATHTPKQQAQLAATFSQTYGTSIRMKWESVERHMNAMTTSCNLIDEMCSLEGPSLVDMTLACNKFYDGELPHPGRGFQK